MEKKRAQTGAARLVVRPLRASDYDAVAELQRRCFPGIDPWTREQFETQVKTFADGQICVELDGKLIATSSSLIVHEADYSGVHRFQDVCDEGLTQHAPDGDTLYGIDIAVDPRHRGMRLARRIYEARKDLVRRLNLRAILIAGRIPGYHKHAAQMSAEEYVRRVVHKELKDAVLTAQTSNGFAIRHVLKGYLPVDQESCGYAVFMEWLNDRRLPDETPIAVPSVRVAAVQYQMRAIRSFDDFAQQCEFFVDAAAEYRTDFLLFPELLTNQLQSLVSESRPGLTARRLSEFTPAYVALFTRLSMKYNINLVAGSHLCVEDGTLFNIAYLFRRDGSTDKQYKLHIPPAERHWWGVSPGNELRVFDTDRGKIAVLIGYDVEFPEIARVATASGASLFFVPFNTDLRSAYMRVRACAQARCIENHVYAVLAGSVGNLPLLRGADIHYGQSCILTPCDVPFARDGVADEATANVETMVVQELDFEVLRKSRRSGSFRPWHDRRPELYAVRYRDREV